MRNNRMDGSVQMNGTADADLRRTAELIVQIEALRDAERNHEAGSAKPERSAEMSINLLELVFFLISKLHFVVLGMLVGTLVMSNYATQRSVPIYTATAKLYIVGQNSNSIVSLSDLQMGMALAMDYQEVFRTWEVHAMVNEELGTNYSYAQLQQMITITNPEATRILYISVRNTDAQRAADIANAYINAGKRFITNTMKTDEPSAFSVALVPAVASSISVQSYAMRGLLLGAALVIGVLVLIFLLDSRPKSTDDILEYGGIPTLAVIPANEQLSGKGLRSTKRGRHK